MKIVEQTFFLNSRLHSVDVETIVSQIIFFHYQRFTSVNKYFIHKRITIVGSVGAMRGEQLRKNFNFRNVFIAHALYRFYDPINKKWFVRKPTCPRLVVEKQFLRADICFNYPEIYKVVKVMKGIFMKFAVELERFG